jgi:hypothetical protein
MTRERLAKMTGVPEDEVAVEMHLADPAMRAAAERFHAKQDLAEQAGGEAAKEQKVAAVTLTSKLTVRDVAAILGYSHQLIAKLAPKKDRKPGWVAPGVRSS